jgi:hypothetical protein
MVFGSIPFGILPESPFGFVGIPTIGLGQNVRQNHVKSRGESVDGEEHWTAVFRNVEGVTNDDGASPGIRLLPGSKVELAKMGDC